MEVSNEYQDSYACLNPESGKQKLDMKKKFRVWRGLVPRNNGTIQRIRNLWSMITLGRKPGDNDKVVIHDVTVKYTV